MKPMAPAEYGELLNRLLEAERAGAKLLSAYLDELSPHSFERESIRAVQQDEAHNCAVLIGLLRDAAVAPTAAVGDFYDRGLTIRGLPERLRFLNRGQAWVAKRIAAALPGVPASGRAALQEMYDSHLRNIGSCEALLGTPALAAASNVQQTP